MRRSTPRPVALIIISNFLIDACDMIKLYIRHSLTNVSLSLSLASQYYIIDTNKSCKQIAVHISRAAALSTNSITKILFFFYKYRISFNPPKLVKLIILKCKYPSRFLFFLYTYTKYYTTIYIYTSQAYSNNL